MDGNLGQTLSGREPNERNVASRGKKLPLSQHENQRNEHEPDRSRREGTSASHGTVTSRFCELHLKGVLIKAISRVHRVTERLDIRMNSIDQLPAPLCHWQKLMQSACQRENTRLVGAHLGPVPCLSLNLPGSEEKLSVGILDASTEIVTAVAQGGRTRTVGCNADGGPRPRQWWNKRPGTRPGKSRGEGRKANTRTGAALGYPVPCRPASTQWSSFS